MQNIRFSSFIVTYEKTVESNLCRTLRKACLAVLQDELSDFNGHEVLSMFAGKGIAKEGATESDPVSTDSESTEDSKESPRYFTTALDERRAKHAAESNHPLQHSFKAQAAILLEKYGIAAGTKGISKTKGAEERGADAPKGSLHQFDIRLQFFACTAVNLKVSLKSDLPARIFGWLSGTNMCKRQRSEALES